MLGALGALVVIAAGGYYAMRTRNAQEDQAAGMLAEAQVMFWQGDYSAGHRAGEARVRPVSRHAQRPRRAPTDGRLRSTGAGNFKGAIAEYQKYLALQKSGALADAARRSLAYAYESAGSTPTPRRSTSLVGVFDRESSAEFLLAAHAAASSSSRGADATQSLKRLLDEFGDTPQATRAREMIGELGGPAH